MKAIRLIFHFIGAVFDILFRVLKFLLKAVLTIIVFVCNIILIGSLFGAIASKNN